MSLDIQEVEIDGRKATMSNFGDGLKKMLFEDGEMLIVRIEEPSTNNVTDAKPHKSSKPLKN